MKSYCKKDYCKVDYFMTKIFIEGNFYETERVPNLYESTKENKVYFADKNFDILKFKDEKLVPINDVVKIIGCNGEYFYFSLNKEYSFPYYGDYFLDEMQVRKEKLKSLE